MILSWLFFFHRKMRPMKENAPQGSHCGGMVECRLRDPPQAENPASRILFLFFSGKEAQHENRTLYGAEKCGMV